MGNVKELHRKKINKAAATYLCDQDEGDLYDAYNKLVEAQEKGNGNACADNYVVIWQPLEHMRVDEIIDLIESNIDDEPEVPEFIRNIDWSELRNQKASLLAVIHYYEINKVPFIPEHLTGILHLIDALQDYAVDVVEISAIHVYDFELEESRENSTPTEAEILEFKNKWGQKHNDICAELGYSRQGSDELLMEDYFWVHADEKWYNKEASLFTDREQEIADYLRNSL